MPRCGKSVYAAEKVMGGGKVRTSTGARWGCPPPPLGLGGMREGGRLSLAPRSHLGATHPHLPSWTQTATCSALESRTSEFDTICINSVEGRHLARSSGRDTKIHKLPCLQCPQSQKSVSSQAEATVYSSSYCAYTAAHSKHPTKG